MFGRLTTRLIALGLILLLTGGWALYHGHKSRASSERGPHPHFKQNTSRGSR
jgi:hypothetical protein